MLEKYLVLIGSVYFAADFLAATDRLELRYCAASLMQFE